MDKQDKAPDNSAAEPDQSQKPADTQDGANRRLREAQRRRLIVSGLATPALLSLPSRRVWATTCTKSRLLSGNVSGPKRDELEAACEVGCAKTFWKNKALDSQWDPSAPPGASMTSVGFMDAYRDKDQPDSAATLRAVLNGDVKAPPEDGEFEWDKLEGDLKSLGPELIAAYNNALVLNQMNLVVDYPLSASVIQSSFNDIIATYLVTADENTAKAALKALEDQLKDLNKGDGIVCPLPELG